jgi:hypothetical protein
LRALPDWSAVPSDSREAAAFEQLILSCLAKSPEARPQSATVLRDTLSRLGLAQTWTAAEAQTWWDAEAPAILALVKVDQRSRQSSPATVAIDLLRRNAQDPPVTAA